MNTIQHLRNLGQSLWLDSISRPMLDDGRLERYATELAVTGLTSNPTIFDHAITNSSAYDAVIRKKLDEGKSGEDLFFEAQHLELCYATDTLIRVLETNPSMLESKVLIMECTFYDERKSLADARAGCHVHLDELVPV